jgi:uncharacterized membrane protein
MALDHVRDNFMAGAEQDPLANPNVTAGLFLTRWVTHFCAPVFVCLAGTSAGLMVARKTSSELAWFLATRGAWLLVIECAVITPINTFSPFGMPELGGSLLVVMQVIWAIGIGMIVLAGAQWLGRPACLALGVAVLVSHNLLDLVWPVTEGPLDQRWAAWVALHAQMSIQTGPFLVVFVYPILPWIGLMLAGFGAAGLFESAPDRRRRLLVRSGLALTLAFIALRSLDVYGDPNPWQVQRGGAIATAIDFLNTTKYPPSLAFLLMTLGPALMLCAFADRFRGRVAEALIVYGRVPFAFYVAHFLLIHLLSVAVGVLQGFEPQQMFTLFLFYPAGYGVTLPWVYGVWALVVLLLYPLCRWTAGVKARRRDWWLSYV